MERDRCDTEGTMPDLLLGELIINTSQAKLSSLSIGWHQSQPGHMTEWGMLTIYLSLAPDHVCSALS